MKFEKKDEIISKLPVTLYNITDNVLLKDPSVALSNSDLMPETAPSNYNENILPSAEDCSIQQTVKDKENCASITVSSTKYNKQLTADSKSINNSVFFRKQQVVKSDENCALNDPSPEEINYMCWYPC